MYLPKHFTEQSVDVLHQAITTNPLGTLVTLHPDGLEANHIPFLVKGDRKTLQGHVARANPVWQTVKSDTEVLIIFHGPQAYVSPSWYPSKSRHGKVVPTWNYIVVHVYGRLSVIQDQEWLATHVANLTRQQERDRPQPWGLDDAPADYIGKMLGAIVGLEVTVSRIEGKWKLSQNRDKQDRQGVIDGLLSEDPASVMAKIMSR